jgi:peptidoglycan/LPS O-acetylase OafA/YrhL
VWFAVQVRQVSERNPVARLGDYTYGLYLVHVPLMFAVFYPAVMRQWTLTPEQVVLVAGAVAVTGGLLFGKLESAVHTRLRPLAKVRLKFGLPARWVKSLLRRKVGCKALKALTLHPPESERLTTDLDRPT